VHVSVSNPSEDLDLAYYRGKAVVERMVRESGLSYAIIRPTLIFGEGDLLINNIAWFLRRFPAFAVPGDGRYRVQPVSGEDVAQLALAMAQAQDNRVVDAAGPEVFTFSDFVRLIARHTGSKAAVLHVPYRIALACCSVVGRFVGDIVLNAQEIKGLMENLLVSKGPPTGMDRFSDWLPAHAAHLGRSYVSELRRNFKTHANR
jgi:nucleoside-diphosphate-sugar epimerase